MPTDIAKYSIELFKPGVPATTGVDAMDQRYRGIVSGRSLRAST
jgi:hypothetical protein